MNTVVEDMNEVQEGEADRTQLLILFLVCFHECSLSFLIGNPTD